MLKSTAVKIGLVLLILSSFPLFSMGREAYINNKILGRYEMMTAGNQDGYPKALDSRLEEVNGYQIEIVEEPTGRKETLMEHEIEFGEVPREIVMAQIVVDGQTISEPYEIKLGARMDHTRYFSYIEILTVKDKKEQKERVAILVTREPDDVGAKGGVWDIFWLDGDSVTKETFSLSERGNHLAARMINYAGLSNMSFGYYSDINHYYPTLAFPIIYPFGTVVIGILLFIFGGSYAVIRTYIK